MAEIGVGDTSDPCTRTGVFSKGNEWEDSGEFKQ